MEKPIVPKLRQEVNVKADIITSHDIKIYYTGKFQDFTARYIIKELLKTSCLIHSLIGAVKMLFPSTWSKIQVEVHSIYIYLHWIYIFWRHYLFLWKWKNCSRISNL